MEVQWIGTQYQKVDKKDDAGRLYGWLRGENPRPPVVLDGKRPYAIVNPRPFLGRTVHHGTKVDKVAMPVPVLDDDASWETVLDAFSATLAPYLPVRARSGGSLMGVLTAGTALLGARDGPPARDALVPVAGLRPDASFAEAAQAFEEHSVPQLAILDAAGAVSGVLPRTTLIRLQDRSDHAAGRNDRRPDNEALFDEPVGGHAEAGWGTARPDTPFAELRDRLQGFPCLFVVDAHGQYQGVVAAPNLLRALHGMPARHVAA